MGLPRSLSQWIRRRQVHRWILLSTFLRLCSFTHPCFDIGDPGVFKSHDCINMFRLLKAAEPTSSWNVPPSDRQPLFVSAIVDLTSVANVSPNLYGLVIGLVPFLMRENGMRSLSPPIRVVNRPLSWEANNCISSATIPPMTTFPLQFCYCHIHYQSGCETNRVGIASAP
jgi:hypothetical protein